MCCFTQPVIDVNSTKIFVRVCDRKQFLAYQMKLSADKDLAMILPLPIANKDKATSNTLPLKFIDLSGYEDFFKDIQRCFRVPPTRFTKRDIACAGIESTLLKVYSVGSFEASYVPSVSDFHRLDPRFRLSNDIWKKLPQYERYGFAVFKLKP